MKILSVLFLTCNLCYGENFKDISYCEHLELYNKLYKQIDNMQSQGMAIRNYEYLQDKKNDAAIEALKYEKLCKIEEKNKK